MAGGSVKEERKREGRKGTDKIRTGKRKMEIKGGVKKKYSCKARGTGKREIEKAKKISGKKINRLWVYPHGDNQGHLSELTLKMSKLNCRGAGRWRREELAGTVP